MKKEYQKTLETKKDLKRFLITMLCSAPVLFIIAVLLGDKVNRVLRIFLFAIVLAIIWLVEEFIHSKIKNKKEVEKEDVFK